MDKISGMVSADITRFPSTCHPLCLAYDGRAEHALTSKAVSALSIGLFRWQGQARTFQALP